MAHMTESEGDHDAKAALVAVPAGARCAGAQRPAAETACHQFGWPAWRQGLFGMRVEAWSPSLNVPSAIAAGRSARTVSGTRALD
jgi:hypothetical protein